MPYPFQVILIAGAVAYLLTSVLFLVTRNMPRTNAGAGWWAVSSLAAGLGYVALLVLAQGGQPAQGEALYNTLFVVWASALYVGGSQFLGRSVRTAVLLAAAAAVALWLIYFYFIAPAFLPAALAVALFCGVLNLHLSWLFVRYAEPRTHLHWALVGALLVSGLHWLDYPLLRPVEWFAPLGFSLCAIISVVINSLLAAMVLVQFRERMLAAEQAALRAATRDALTGLGNRIALDAQFEQAASQAQRHRQGMALLFIDLDGFKPINDQFGHEVGDLVLVNVARRLRSVLRKSDIVARIGGDEFVVILTEGDAAEREVTRQLVDKLLMAIREPMILEGQRCQVQASIGVSYFPEHGSTLNHLMSAADKDMYHTKRHGKNGFTVAALAG